MERYIFVSALNTTMSTQKHTVSAHSIFLSAQKYAKSAHDAATSKIALDHLYLGYNPDTTHNLITVRAQKEQAWEQVMC